MGSGAPVVAWVTRLGLLVEDAEKYVTSSRM